jgi:hypothetical protein
MTAATANKPGANSKPADPKKTDAKAERNPYQLPPDEEFWKRYSPHYEAPISGTTSFFGHLIILGAFAGLAYLWLLLGWNHVPPIEFQAVRMPGGGGGNPNGVGDATGVGDGPKEDVNGTTPSEDVLPLPDRAPLDKVQVDTARQIFSNDDDAVRLIQGNNPNIDAMMKNLNKDVIDRLRDGMMPGKGQGGPGQGGGKGNGRGPGEGGGIGNGGGQLSERERRMLRWVMVFETQNPNDYVNQLAGLGAILAIPTKQEGEYHVIRDLHKRPAKPELEDVAKLNRIYWVDDKPQSVSGVMRVLGLPANVSHFVAFMPQELEIKLGEKELKYRGLAEDQIFETKFRVVRLGGGAYDVEVKQQSQK